MDCHFTQPARSAISQLKGRGQAGRHFPPGCSRRSIGAALLLPVLICFGLTSCTPNLLQMRQQNAAMVLSMYRAKPLAAANNGQTRLAPQDCVRLALANSLDLQAAFWDEKVKSNAAKGSMVRMLPRVESNFELSQRDRPSFSRSDVINEEGLYEVSGPGPGTGVTNFSTGREHTQRTWNTQIKWSPMDSCMARYLATARSNEALHSRYQRVRVAQQLVGATTAAFFRLLALNQALPKVQALESNRAAIVRDLASLAEKALVENQELITARSLLAEAKSQLSEIYISIQKQRELLAAAMNVFPDSDFTLAGGLTPLPQMNLDSNKLESIALVNRPEAYQADLKLESTSADYKRLIVKLFPRVDGYIGYFRDENKFLLNKNWIDGGMRITWDLMDFTATLLDKEAAKDTVFKSDRERALISMGILTQVKLKTLEAVRAVDRVKKTTDLRNQAAEALRIAKEQERARDRGAPSSVMRIARQRALCIVLQSEADRLLALGEVHAALADLNAAVGTNYSVAEAHPPATPTTLAGTVMRPVSALHGVMHRMRGLFGY